MLYWLCETNLITQIRSTGIFILIDMIYFFVIHIFEFGKNANSNYVGVISCTVHNDCLATVGVCVFRALASAGALFYCRRLICLSI